MTVFSIIEGRDPLLSIEMGEGDSVIAESNAMVMMDNGVSVEGAMQGGILSSIARNMFSGESFFQQVLKANKGRDGHALLAPQLPGDIKIVDVGAIQYYLNSGSFMACDNTVSTSQKVNKNILGMFFGDVGGMVIMQTEGIGKMCLSGFGQLIEVNISPDEPTIIDNGHVVAWDKRLSFKVRMASSKRGIFGRAASAAMSGEFLVTEFSGEGIVLVCSRNQLSFEEYIKSIVLKK